MGAGASIAVPPEFESLQDEDKQKLRDKFESLISEGKTPEQAIAALSTTCEGLPQRVEINLVDLMTAIEAAVSDGLTPLIVDNSEDDKVNTFFQYRAVQMLDAKKMGLDVSMRNVPIEEVMEGARKHLVAALKYGSYLVICMTVAATDFATKFNDDVAFPNRDDSPLKEYFPKEVFEKAGKKLLEEKHLEALFRPEDKVDTSGMAICRDPATFKVIITTKFAPEDFEEYLFGNDWGLPKPKHNYRFIIVKSSSE